MSHEEAGVDVEIIPNPTNAEAEATGETAATAAANPSPSSKRLITGCGRVLAVGAVLYIAARSAESSNASNIGINQLQLQQQHQEKAIKHFTFVGNMDIARMQVLQLILILAI